MAGLGISFVAATHCREEVAAGKLVMLSLGPDPMVRQIALIYRKDKALSKAALGFIEVVLENALGGARVPTRPAASGERALKVVPAEG
jgi:DNA-binding transcriptional LysR family regulator